VSPGGAAEAAGIRVGDTIVAVNGTNVKGGAREVVSMLRQIEPESTVAVRVMRDGKPKDFQGHGAQKRSAHLRVHAAQH
jgi:serine protease Do